MKIKLEDIKHFFLFWKRRSKGLIKQVDALNLNHEVTKDGKIKFKHEKDN